MRLYRGMGDHDDCHDHSPGGAEPSFEDDAAIARAALAAGDARHALHHVACAVSTGADRPACGALIDELVAALGDDPLATVPATGLWFGMGGLRAELLARAGRHAEAIPLLLACLAAVPDAPFVPWLTAWVARPGVAATVDPQDVARELVACARHEPLGAALHELARALHDAHPDHDFLAFAAIKLHRLCWRYADAIAIGRAAITRGPRPMTAIGLAGALREDGDLDGAIAAFAEALRHQPDNAGILLDLGDLELSQGRLDRALDAYQRALALEPDEPWAAPSALFVRWRAGDGDAAAALRTWAATHPDNRRAAELAAQLDG